MSNKYMDIQCTSAIARDKFCIFFIILLILSENEKLLTYLSGKSKMVKRVNIRQGYSKKIEEVSERIERCCFKKDCGYKKNYRFYSRIFHTIPKGIFYFPHCLKFGVFDMEIES